MKSIHNLLIAAFLTIAVCFAVVYVACKKDNCNSVICLNGGACNGGNCNCLVGYEGNNCETLSRDKFIFTFNGSDTCSNNDLLHNQYPIEFLAIPGNNIEMNMKDILHNVNDSAVCTMQSADSFSFIGSNNGTSYSGSGKLLHNDTLVLYYHVQQDTSSYNCAYIGGIYL